MLNLPAFGAFSVDSEKMLCTDSPVSGRTFCSFRCLCNNYLIKSTLKIQAMAGCYSDRVIFVDLSEAHRTSENTTGRTSIIHWAYSKAPCTYNCTFPSRQLWRTCQLCTSLLHTSSNTEGIQNSIKHRPRNWLGELHFDALKDLHCGRYQNHD